MDVLLIYFSQTGNTQKITKAMMGGFHEAGHSAKMASLRDARPEDVTMCELVGVGTPCFSSQAPAPLKKFLQMMPPLPDKLAFVYATSGGAPGKVLSDLSKLLRRKGALVLGGFLSRGEVHHPAPPMTGRFPGHPQVADLNRARSYAKAIVEKAITIPSRTLTFNKDTSLNTSFGFYDLLGLISSERILRLMMPEPKPEIDKCDLCSWCVDECPMDNIHLNSYPILGDSCIRCYRCITGCPQDAFQVNWRFASPLLQFLYNPSFMRWFGDLKPDENIY
jgi:ferredoxin/flavodoxin